MAIITISRGCFSHGTQIAKMVADILDYRLVSREQVIDEAAQRYHISEKELLKSLHDAPTIVDRMTHGREKYLSYIQAVLLRHAAADNLVYHGNAGHFLLPEIDHLLKVRIIADMEDRLSFTQKRENISRQQAWQYIQKDDKHRARWTGYLYNTDINDPHIYDMVLNIGRLSLADACQVIADTARNASYQTTAASQQKLFDFSLSRQVNAAIQTFPETVGEVEVTAHNGRVTVKAHLPAIRKAGYVNPDTEKMMKARMRQDLIEHISWAVEEIPGILDVVYEVETPSFA